MALRAYAVQGLLASVRNDILRKKKDVVPNRCMRQNRVMATQRHRVVCVLADGMTSIGAAIANDFFGAPGTSASRGTDTRSAPPTRHRSASALCTSRSSTASAPCLAPTQ